MSKKISEMTPATQLTGDDIVPIVDTGKNNKTVTGNQIKSFATNNCMTTDSIIIETKNATIPTVGAGSTGSTSVSVTKTGYTPLGIISITGSGSTGLAYSDWYINSTGTAYIYYKNDTTSAKSNVTLGLTILYKKN